MKMSRHGLPASDDFWVRYEEGNLNEVGDLSPINLTILESYLTVIVNLQEAAWKYHDTGILGDAEIHSPNRDVYIA